MATFHKNKVIQSGLKVLVNTLRKIVGNLGVFYPTPNERSFTNKVSLIDPNQSEDSYAILSSPVINRRPTLNNANYPMDEFTQIVPYNGSNSYGDHSVITAASQGGYIVDGSWSFSSWFNIVKPQFFQKKRVSISNIRRKNCILATIHSYNFGGARSSSLNRIVIAKRGPYYRNINGIQYKYQFEPFSFVFTINSDTYGYNNSTSRTFFTDYKFYHNIFYNICIVYDTTNTTFKVFIDGELQQLALVEGAWHIRGIKNLNNHRLSFDPTIYPPNQGYTTTSLYNLPIHPNFKSYFNQTATCPITNQHQIYTSGLSKISVVRLVPHPKILPYKEKFLYNRFIEYGDVQIYNRDLTSDEVVSNYENFYTKYKTDV